MPIRRAGSSALSFLTAMSMAFGVTAAEPAEPVAAANLHQVLKLDGSLYSGNAPEAEAAFQELEKLGVKTIISVDGAKPLVALARRFGMRYVHLPIGYEGLPQQRGAELARAAQSARAQGPVYLHCHHGKHRGPAAAAVICRALDGWSADKADDFLKQAGTSPDYPGLFRDVRTFRPPTTAELARGPEKFPETAATTTVVAAMVALDGHWETLLTAQKTQWREAPAEAAMLAWEVLSEMKRDPELKKRGDDYAEMLMDSTRAADALRKLLREPTAEAAARDAALETFTKTCATCHKAHRN